MKLEHKHNEGIDRRRRRYA